MDRFDSLKDALNWSWHLLFRATQQRQSQFRIPSIATVGIDGLPSNRKVVLREVRMAERQLYFYTDFRSAKVADLQQQPLLSWLFWDARRQLQIRVKARAQLHRGDELAKDKWQRIPVPARKDYASITGPGQPLEAPDSDLPPQWQSESLDQSLTEYAFEHFTVVVSTAEALDVLLLHRKGHQRVQFNWQDSEWQGEWLTP